MSAASAPLLRAENLVKHFPIRSICSAVPRRSCTQWTA